MINNQIRANNHQKVNNVISATFRRPTLKEKFCHVWNCFCGYERVVKDENGKRYFTNTTLGNEHVMAKEQKMASAAAGKVEKTNSFIGEYEYTPVEVVSPVRVRRHRRIRFSLLLPIALLVLRHIVPEVAEEIPYVYEFLDNVVVPIIEWVYKLGMKVFTLLMEQAWFANIIEFFANLAV